MNEPAPADLVLLQTFHEVARTGSVTRAADNLGRSQPAISHRLRLLEQDLGVPLFEKVGRRLRLTEYGHRLQHECLDLMARSQRIRERVVRGREEGEGRVALGTLPTVASHLLAPMLGTFFDEHPRLALGFHLGTVARLCEQLRTGELDVLLVVGHVDPRLFAVEVLGQLSLAAVMRPDRAPKRSRRLAPAWLRRRRYLSYGGERDPTFEIVEEYAREHDLEGEHTPSVPHIETLRELAAAGVGYALIPTYTARRDTELGRLICLPATGLNATVPLSIVGRTEQVITPALEAVRQLLLQLRLQSDVLG